MKDSRVLVVGSGSIGRRHARNLRALGYASIAACDPQPDRLASMVDESFVTPFGDYGRALAEYQPNVVLICTPPVLHLPQTTEAIRAGAHVFVEKPLSNNLKGVEELIALAQERSAIVQVGYNLRFHPAVRQLKTLVETHELGRILWARAEFGQYLPDWRPWQDYRNNYTARQDLGGGILLDGSHEVDYMIWLLGLPSDVSAMAGKVSNLEVDVEDSATILLRFSDGSHADIHLDFIQRSYSRSCKLVGELGSAVWDFPTQEVRVYHAGMKECQVFRHGEDANEMYKAELSSFLSCIEHEIEPQIGLRQAADVLKVVCAAKEAATTGRMERLTWST